MNRAPFIVIVSILLAATGCSAQAQAPPSIAPAPLSTPSLNVNRSQEDKWQTWRLHGGRTVADVAAISKAYGLKDSWVTTPKIKSQGYPIIGLMPGEKCIVLYSGYIGSPVVTWPMRIVVFPRTVPQPGAKVDVMLEPHAASQAEAKRIVAYMANEMKC